MNIIKEADVGKTAYLAAISHETIDRKEALYWEALPKESRDYWKKIELAVLRMAKPASLRDQLARANGR